MNCLEFRRRLGSEPMSTEHEFVAHRESCPHCAAASDRALAFESRLARAVKVPVPNGIADRILLAQTTDARMQQRRHRRGFTALLAAAACVVITVALVPRDVEEVGMPMVDQVVEHVLHHEPLAIASVGTVASAAVSDAFASRGVEIDAVPNGISYVHECPVGPFRTVHMVMPSAQGAVSVVYVADVDARRHHDSQRSDMRVREVPLGRGALVLVAGDDRGFDAVEQAWKAAFADTVADADTRATTRLRERTPTGSPRSATPLAAP
ncbi:MAG: DUF3379 family protein [Dokdonella sp.]